MAATTTKNKNRGYCFLHRVEHGIPALKVRHITVIHRFEPWMTAIPTTSGCAPSFLAEHNPASQERLRAPPLLCPATQGQGHKPTRRLSTLTVPRVSWISAKPYGGYSTEPHTYGFVVDTVTPYRVMYRLCYAESA